MTFDLNKPPAETFKPGRFQLISRTQPNVPGDFLYRLSHPLGEWVLHELEETAYWLELLGESGVLNPDRLNDLQKEAYELSAILVTCVKNVKQRRKV